MLVCRPLLSPYKFLSSIVILQIHRTGHVTILLQYVKGPQKQREKFNRHSYIYHPGLTNINFYFSFQIWFKSFGQVNQICAFLPSILTQVSVHSSCPYVIIILRIYIIGMPADIRVLFPDHCSKVYVTIKWVPQVFWFPQGQSLCVCVCIADSRCCTAQSNTTAKSLQSCPTLCDPIDGSPLGSPVPGIVQARTLEWVAISFSNA